jgi:hypothetical protein
MFNVPIQEEKWVNLGTPAQVLQSDCRYHQPLVEVVMGLADTTPDNIDCFLMSKGRSEYHPTIGAVHSDIPIAPEAFDGYLTLIPWKHREVPIAVPTGFPMQRQWIDLSIPTEWLESCDELHQESCAKPLLSGRLSATRPTFVVDTLKHCLVKPLWDDSYVALSYVWGKRACFVTTRANLEDLQFPGSLSLDRAPTISKTVRDAIGLTRVLMQRYLWVDALCIVQDDESVKHADLMNMGAIYANAVVTIVAAQGDDADAGLRGIEGVSSPRDLGQRICRLANGFIMSARFDYKHGTWHSRGWTYQEELFSRRRIIFEGERIRWECCDAVWHEDIEHGWPKRDHLDFLNAGHLSRRCSRTRFHQAAT